MRLDVDWMEHGACRELHVEIFYPEQPDFADARSVCRRCRVRVECLEHALDAPELFGVWGGCSPAERVELRRERRSKPV